MTIRDKFGYTPLLLAQINRQVDTVEMIQNEIELRQQAQQETEKSLSTTLTSISIHIESLSI